MKKYIGLLFVILLAAGCGRAPTQKEVLARVNNYEITKEEFYDEFKASAHAKERTLEAKKEFLKNLIDRKIILQDAQKKGLDRDEEFLKMIQRFWEQSLLKLAVEKKAEEIAVAPGTSNREIRDIESGFMNDWIADLKKNADIKVNYGMLEEK